MTRSLTVAVLALAALAAQMALFAPASQAKVTRTQFQGKPSGLFVVIPDRWEGDVEPGKTTEVPVSLDNQTDKIVQATISVTDLGPAQDPEHLVEAVEKGAFGAASWMRPELTQVTLKPMEKVSFSLYVTPPVDAPIGTNMGGLLVQASPTLDPQNADGNKVSFRIRGLAQFFFTIPGEVRRDLRVTSATVADTFIFHGSSFVVYELEYENQGNVNDHVSGEIIVRSMFGNTVTTLDVRELVVLRGSKRTVRVIWPKIPKFGRFAAEARLQSDQDKHTKVHPTVTILPPWWWFVIAAVAIALPIGYRIYQNHFAWRRYLDEDEDWYEDLDEDWEEGHLAE